MNMKKSTWFQSTLVGGILVFLSAFLIGLGGVADFIPGGKSSNGVVYGLRATIAEYGKMWTGALNGKRAMVFWACVILAFLFAVIAGIYLGKKKKYFGFVGYVIELLGVLFFPFIAILAAQLIAGSAMVPGAMWTILLSVLFLLVGQLASMVGMVLAPAHGAPKAEVAEAKEEEKPAAAPFDEEAARRIADEQIQKALDARGEEKPALDEDAVKAMIQQAIAAHVEDLHTEYVEEEEEAPVKEEEKPEEEPEEETEDEESEEEAGPEDPFSKLRSKKRASFETRLKKSDADLRHKYYDLRDYIKSYGVNNRLSIPGDTFSAHRERYVFLTINGKHIKAYFALDPKEYENSPIPVETVDSKKYEDLPCCLRIKSDLSFRRAQKLVDDLMAKKGLVKKEEPKEEEAAK